MEVSTLSGTATPGAMGVVILYCFADGAVDAQPVMRATAMAAAKAAIRHVFRIFFMRL
jgi:hypothetical protein